METELITMEPAKAREAFQHYRQSIKKRRTKEDEILMRGYKHLAQGKKILDLIDVMKKAGVDNLGRPELAIARASWEKCFFTSRASGSGRFGCERNPIWIRGARNYTDLPSGVFSQEITNISARVPAIPPQFKPHGSLDNYHILWDATWETEPPSDPILLRHLGRNVYAVLASWDLTPLERALLR